MADFINVAFFVMNLFLSTVMAIVFLLNIFKKKTILERFDMYGDSECSFAGWCSFFVAIIALGYFVQEPDKLYGFSLGTCVNLMLIGAVLFLIVLDAVGDWFKKLPET